jgi:hypothetical protein
MPPVAAGLRSPALTRIVIAIDSAQQVIGRHMRVEIERVEELILRTRLLAHHLNVPFVFCQRL